MERRGEGCQPNPAGSPCALLTHSFRVSPYCGRQCNDMQWIQGLEQCVHAGSMGKFARTLGMEQELGRAMLNGCGNVIGRFPIRRTP
jgi:hypothetical protein